MADPGGGFALDCAGLRQSDEVSGLVRGYAVRSSLRRLSDEDFLLRAGSTPADEPAILEMLRGAFCLSSERTLSADQSPTFDGSLQRHDECDYGPAVMREALLNMVVHRDYSLTGSALVSVFDDRMELVNFGGLPRGMPRDDMMPGVPLQRNPGLARSGAGKLLAGLVAEGAVARHGAGRGTRYHTARQTENIRNEDEPYGYGSSSPSAARNSMRFRCRIPSRCSGRGSRVNR